ncbi:MAG: hypothetical protein ACD_75C02446G0001, partial [uncultured bacterium]
MDRLIFCIYLALLTKFPLPLREGVR